MMDSRDFLREARIMKELRHPNLIQLYAVGIISKFTFFINSEQKNWLQKMALVTIVKNGLKSILEELPQIEVVYGNSPSN